MVNREENPLQPLLKVRLTDGEKKAMWDNIVERATTERTTKCAHDHDMDVRRKHKSSRRIGLASGLAMVGVFALVGYTNPKLLDIPKMFNLLDMKMFSTQEVSKAVSLGYGESVNQSVTSNGITLTIGNVYADETKLTFDMVESFEKGRLDKPVIRDEDMTLNVNGTRKLIGFSGGEFRAVAGGKYAGIVYFPVMNDQPYKPLPSTFTLNVHIHKIGDITGDWSFSIPVSQSKLQRGTKDFRPNVTVSNKGYMMTITDVKVNAVQTLMEGTMTVPAGGSMPDRMIVIDSTGQVVGGGMQNEKVVGTSTSGRVVQFVLEGTGLSSGSTGVSVTPMRDFSSPVVPLQGDYPKGIIVLPGLPATITGIEFRADSTVVQISMNQAEYKRLTSFQGHNIAGQFFLVWQDAKSSDSVGSKSITFDSPTSNTAQIVFGKVDRNKLWGLGNSFTVVQNGLELNVPLK